MREKFGSALGYTTEHGLEMHRGSWRIAAQG
jgi:hypothetical protein